MSVNTLADLARRVAEYAGLDPPGWVLEARAKERAARVTDGNLDAYCAFLESDGGELDLLTEALRVGETRFFRHAAQVEALARRVIPERAAALSDGRDRLRAWSAGCASGEEAWTLAVQLAESGKPFELLATDISDAALAVARAGRYRIAAGDDVPPALRARHFTVENDQLVVNVTLRNKVRFERRNLLDAPYPRGFDLILCRNVLIYFEGARRDDVVARLAESLLPGGYLFLGYSETLRSHEHLFEALRDEGGVVYRRRDRPARIATPSAVPVVLPAGGQAIGQPPPRKRTETVKTFPPVATKVSSVRLRGSYDVADAARLTAELKPILDGTAQSVELDGAAFLGDEAARILARVAGAANGKVKLRAARASVRRWLSRHELDRLFLVDEGDK
jgi:chemotaxis methyl-accepting protein methylase